MNKVCPACGRVSPVESPFCPACGAPMSGEAEKRQNDQRDHERIPALMPMKWHKFIKFIALPLGMALAILNLADTLPLLTGFDPAMYLPGMAGTVKFSLWLDVIVNALSLPLMLTAELGLIRMKKNGLRALAVHYALQVLYGVTEVVLLLRAGLPAATAILSTAEIAVMLALNAVYYRKRWGLFT